jgi:trimeric autotransporter adhesin
LIGAFAFNGTGNADSNIIRGNAADNVLNGGGGNDSLYGGLGNDTYIHRTSESPYAYNLYTPVTPTIFENNDEGYDSIVTNALSLILPQNVERLWVNYAYIPASLSISHNPYADPGAAIYSHPPGANYHGNDLDNVIDVENAYFYGFLAPSLSRIDGGAGKDILIGGNVATTYVIDNIDDVIIDKNFRNAQVESSITYTLGANFTNLYLIGTNAIDGFGNQTDNILDGSYNVAANHLVGFAGNDTYRLGESDTVSEGVNGGIDTIILTASLGGTTTTINLGDWENFESIELNAAVGNMNVRGTADNNTIKGNVYSNNIEGLDGDDTIYNLIPRHYILPRNPDNPFLDNRYTLHDPLDPYNFNYVRDDPFNNNAVELIDGGDGNDTIYSYGGSGSIYGGAGDDRIYIDTAKYLSIDAGAGNDLIISEGYSRVPGRYPMVLSFTFGVGSGNDTVSIDVENDASLRSDYHRVHSQIELSARTDVSNLRFTRDGASLIVHLLGSNDSLTITEFFESDLSNVIQSKLDSIRLPDGTMLTRGVIRAGLNDIDLQTGTSVDDLLITTESNRSVTGAAGNDQLVGQSWADHLAGGDGDDYLFGRGGADEMAGGTGNDLLIGGHGNDRYIFSAGWGQDVVDDLQSLLSISPPYTSLVDDGGIDEIVFDSSVSVADIAVSFEFARYIGGNLFIDLFLTNRTSGDTIRLTNYFVSVDNAFAPGQIELIRFADGTVWDQSYVNRMIRTVTGTSGADTLYSRDIDTEMFGLGGNDTLYGQWYSDKLYGGEGNDILGGSYGNDLLDGGVGSDQMFGGVDDDDYIVDSATDTVTEYVDEGTDTVFTELTYTLGVNIENLTLTGTSAINGTGNTSANVLIGNDAENVLNGGTGADSLSGYGGNDTYLVDNLGDMVVEGQNGGIDTVQAVVSYTLSRDIENLTLTGTSAINATGNDLDNVLTGNSNVNTLSGGVGSDTLNGLAGNDILNGGAGNDTLNGGAGNDNMRGGLGNDTYVVDSASDIVTELFNEGVDLVQASVTHTLAANVDSLTLTGTTAINGTGNLMDNVLIGNSAVNTLTGGDGNDTLDGGAGADKFLGGKGNDTYLVDNAAELITENLSEGVDVVQSSVAYTLTSNVENLTLIAGAAINGTGNTMSNVLTGNSAANTLNGGTGADTMRGGAGNDTYVVDNLGDVVAENFNEGTDLVQAGVTYALAANIENLTLTGSTAINATGNLMDNVLTGNTGINVLTGGAGNDTYVVAAGDTTIELAGGGIDTVQSNIVWTLAAEVENLTLLGTTAANGTGNTSDNVLMGNSAANTLTGGAGNDTISAGAGNDIVVGGAGKDVLTGGAGTDVFDFNLIAESGVGAPAYDLITDFLAGTDRIDLLTMDANSVIAGDQAFAFIGTGAFTGAGQLRYSFNGTNTLVQGNVDAVLGADFEILLTGNQALLAANFVL